MPNLMRGLAQAAGGIAETAGQIERENIKHRHAMAMEKVKGKYADKARAENQKFSLDRDTQAQKERFRVSEYEMGETTKAADVKYERGEAGREKQYAHEIQKAKIAASGRGSGQQSARMSLTNQVWDNLKAVRPDDDPNELWLEAFKLSNEKKELSPEADQRDLWSDVYNKAIGDPLFPVDEEEARAMADEAVDAYKKKWYPESKTQRERFKKQKRSGKALGAQNGDNPDMVQKGEALGATAAPESAQSRKQRLQSIYK